MAPSPVYAKVGGRSEASDDPGPVGLPTPELPSTPFYTLACMGLWERLLRQDSSPIHPWLVVCLPTTRRGEGRRGSRPEADIDLRLPALLALLAHQTPPRAQGIRLRGDRRNRRHRSVLLAGPFHGTRDAALRLRRPSPGGRVGRDQGPGAFGRSGAHGAWRGVSNRELRRIALLRGWVNKGKKKGRGFQQPRLSVVPDRSVYR